MNKKTRKKISQILDRILGFCIATAFVLGFFGLGLGEVCVNGSPALRSKFISTFSESRRFGFVPHIFLPDEEIDEWGSYFTGMFSAAGTVTDTSMVVVDSESVDENGVDQYGLVYADGINYSEVRYKGSTFYMITVLDPTRVFVGMPDSYGGYGLVLEDMVNKYDAIGGINAGAFIDYSGAGTGGDPAGITIIDGVCYNDEPTGSVAGITEDGVLYCGYYDYQGCQTFGFKYAVSFNPVLIINGVEVGEDSLEGGINPRTCIGQRADGAIVMVAVDGRQAYSVGVSQKDCADFLLSYGVINAINMDGGSSTCLYYDGELRNHPSGAAGGTRYLPTAWLVK